MDNLPVHKVAGVAEAIQAAGAMLFYLPKYSPDLRQEGRTVTCDELRYLETEGAQKPASLIDDDAD